MSPRKLPAWAHGIANTTLDLLMPREPHHNPSNDTFRSDATMSAHDRAIKLRNLTIGWTLGIILAVLLIGLTIYCIVGKRRCGLRPRDRDPTGYDVRMAGASSSIPRVEDFDTRTEAQKRDEAMWKGWEERDRLRREAREAREARERMGKMGVVGS